MDINLDISVHSYQSKSAKTVLDTILEIQPKDSSGGGSGETRESIVYRICDDMLEKLPNDYDPFEVKARLEKMGRLQPMNIFLKQEIDRMQRVISLVRSTLSDLKLAIDGTIIMSESLRDALDCMYDARIPKLWQKVSANVSYLWNIKTKSIILKLDICIIIYQVFEIGIYFEFLCFVIDFMGFQYPWVLVHRVDWQKRPIPYLVLRWPTCYVLDDWILQRSGIPYSNETGQELFL